MYYSGREIFFTNFSGGRKQGNERVYYDRSYVSYRCAAQVRIPKLTQKLQLKLAECVSWEGGMILWYWYVVAIAGLSLYGYVTLNVPLTAALAVTAHLLRRFTSSRSRAAAGFAAASVAAAALALLWRESCREDAP